MSTVFSTFDVARSGMGAYKTWLNAVADNVSNLDNVTTTDSPAFQERFVEVAAARNDDGSGGGAIVTAMRLGDPNGRVTHEPNHPLADANGMVRRPDIEMSDQMVYLQVAQRGYQANINSFQRARDAYEAALSIGR